MFVVEKQKQQTFDFQIEGLKKIHKVPLINNLPMEYIKKARNLTSDNEEETLARTMDFTDEIFEEYAPGVIDKLTVEQYQLLIEAYFSANGDVTLGE